VANGNEYCRSVLWGMAAMIEALVFILVAINLFMLDYQHHKEVHR
jgi:hypothetical protein